MDSPHENMQSLPEDAEALRALILATFAERDAAVSERDTLLAQNDRLRHLLLKLTRMHFGALEQAIAKEDAEAESGIPSCAKTMRPSGGRAAARYRRTCHGSR